MKLSCILVGPIMTSPSLSMDELGGILGGRGRCWSSIAAIVRLMGKLNSAYDKHSITKLELISK